MQIVYTENARKRIGKLGSTSILGFVDELSSAQRGRVLAVLPRLQGFRKNSPLELKERAKTFATAISHATDHKFREHDIEWKAFTIVWLCWAKNTFGIELDEFAGTTQSELLAHVSAKAGEFHTSREELGKLLLFSYLPDDSATDSLVAALPTREELNRRRLVAELPTKVDVIGQRLDDLLHRFGEIENAFAKDPSHESGSHPMDIHESRIKAIELQVDRIEQRVSKECADREASIEAMNANVGTIRDQSAENTVRLRRMSSSVNSTDEQVSALRQMIDLAASKLEEIQQAVSNLTVSAANGASNAALASFDAYSPLIEICEPPSGAQVKTLDGVASMVQLLMENFHSAGVSRDDAESVARIVAAGLVAGQLTQFSGSMADLLADIVCSSVFGNEYLKCDVPIGLCDGGLFAKCWREIENSPRARALVLRGANRSAFEVYGGQARDVILRRQVGRAEQLDYRALISTTISGASVLDGSESMTDLGPIVDSDHLSWTIPRWKKVRYGALKEVRLQSLYKADDDITDLLQTINQVVRDEKRSTALRRSVLIRAGSALALIPNLDESVRLELLLTGWMVPLLRNRAVDEEAIRERVANVLGGSDFKVELLKASLGATYEA